MIARWIRRRYFPSPSHRDAEVGRRIAADAADLFAPLLDRAASNSTATRDAADRPQRP